MSRLRLLVLGRFSLRPPMSGHLIRIRHLPRELGHHHDVTFVSIAYDETIPQLKRIYGRSCEGVILVKYRDVPMPGVADLPEPVRRAAITPLLDTLYWLDTSTYDAPISIPARSFPRPTSSPNCSDRPVWMRSHGNWPPSRMRPGRSVISAGWSARSIATGWPGAARGRS